MDVTICDAIRGRRVIRFVYDGGMREAEPWCHGTSRTGREVLRAWQVGGASTSGEPVGWKFFEVAKMGSMQQTGALCAASRPGYKVVYHIFCKRVEPW